MLYLGLDLSTQQLKGFVVDQHLKPVYLAKVEFDTDLPAYNTVKGVYSDESTGEVTAPVAMWLDALDLLLWRLGGHVDLAQLVGISGACQQHGSVFWRTEASMSLQNLSAQAGHLRDQLAHVFAWDQSPNWQDHSTRNECQIFEQTVGGADALARLTGSKAHHRFTGPQILKVKSHRPEVYAATDRISLVSSFLESVLLGDYAALEVSDVCGMNLWDLEKRQWHTQLLELLGSDAAQKLGPVGLDGKHSSGTVSSYFVEKYGVNPKCQIVPFTGDNPGTILALPLEPNDVIVSLGTSTTALVVTHKYVPSPLYHIFTHPVNPDAYMGMLCYCNGSLAREKIRDELNRQQGGPANSWDAFDSALRASADKQVDQSTVGFYFPLDEIIPDAKAQTLRLKVDDSGKLVKTTFDAATDAIKIVESQALSIRHRLAPMLTTAKKTAGRVYFVGGGSRNRVMCEALARVLVPEKGAYVLDLADACSKGAANKAVYACEAAESMTWDEFISSHWDTGAMAEVKTHPSDGYAELVPVFVQAEEQLR